MRLRELQARVMAQVTTQVTAEVHTACPLPLRRSDNPAIDNATRLKAYRDNVQGAHLAALDNVYPVTADVLGPRYWRHLLKTTITRFGSASGDLNAYGSFVPRLLHDAQKSRPELADFPYLGDLARLEWAVHRLRLAPQDPAFPWTDFMALSEQIQTRATLIPARAVSRFESAFPVHVIWSLHAGASESADAGPDPVVCCLHRNAGFDVSITRLRPRQAALLAAIIAGRNLRQIAAETETTRQERVMQQLYDWIAQGWITGFEVR